MALWTVPGYVEVRRLGSGGSGQVVEARAEASGSEVAIKYLSDQLFAEPGFITRFRDEARLLTEVVSPNIVRLLEYVESPLGAAIVMELIDGLSLHELISRRGPTSPESALSVLKGSLLGLAAAHAVGVVHRDYKPENVLIDRAGLSKLADFGIATRAGRGAPGLGTPLYMAPEQWAGSQVTPESDIYAATATFHECLTGQPPFTGRVRQLRQQHESAQVPLEGVPEALRDLVRRGMAKDPAERPGDAAAFVGELEQIAVDAYGEDWEERGREQLAERVGALLLLLLGAGAGGGLGAVASTVLTRRRLAIVGTAVVTVTALTIVSAFAISHHGHHRRHHGRHNHAVAATVTAMPAVAMAICKSKPLSISFAGTITVQHPGDVTYEWVGSSGPPGAPATLHFASGGAKQVSLVLPNIRRSVTGWEQLKLTSPVGVESNRASYEATCQRPGSHPHGISATASVDHAATTITCGQQRPSFTFTGTIRDAKPGTVRYYWARGDGTASAPSSLVFSAAGTRSVLPDVITPAADNYADSDTIVITTPVKAASNAAMFTLSCIPPGQGGPKIGASAKVSPASEAITCGASPPAFSFTGSISDSQPGKVSYHWAFSDGTHSPSATLTFAAAGAAAAQPYPYTPPADHYTGSGTLVVTSPVAASSAPASFSLTCQVPKIAVSNMSSTPASPATFSCGQTRPTFTITANISTDLATKITYDFVRSDGSRLGSHTFTLGSGQATTVSDHWTPPKDKFSGKDTLTITAPTQVSSSIPISLSCTTSHVIRLAVGNLQVTVGRAADTGSFNVTIAVSTTDPVTLTWAASESADGSPGRPASSNKLTFSGKTIYTIPITGVTFGTAHTGFAVVQATATGTDGQTVPATVSTRIG